MKKLASSFLLLTLLATPLYAGVLFDNTDDLFDCGPSNNADNVSAITIFAWINPSTVGENSAGRIVKKGSGTTNDGWRFTLASTNAIQFVVDWTTDLIRTSGNNAVTMSTDSSVIVTCSDMQLVANTHLYINGVEVNYTGGTQQNGATTRVDDSGGNIYVGSDSGLARTFNGRISEAAVWSSVLVSNDIAILSNSKVKGIARQISPATLEGYWLMDECGNFTACSGTGQFKDSSENSNNCTPTNSPQGRAESVLSYA